MVERETSQTESPESGSRFREIFLRSWRRLAAFAFRSHGTMILTALLFLVLATAAVYGLVHLLHFLGFSKRAAAYIAVPAGMLASWFGTSMLNQAARHLALWIRGEKLKRPAALDDPDYPFLGTGQDRVDLSSVSGRILRNGSWICSCGRTHPFTDAVCSCGRSRPEGSEEPEPMEESDW